MKTLELFSGAGGLAKGLELAGFETIKLVESNKHACATLQRNFGCNKVFDGDIRDLSYADLNGIQLVAGGPPCQPFSVGGKHKAQQDARDMFPCATHAIKTLQPKAFLFENVKGLLRSSFSEYFEYILLRLTYPNYKSQLLSDWQLHLKVLRGLYYDTYQDLKYSVFYQLLNAVDFGVPQNRERVFIIGFRDDLGASWENLKPTHYEDRLLWDKFVTGKYWDRHKIANKQRESITSLPAKKLDKLRAQYGLFVPPLHPWQTVRDALSTLPEPELPHSISDHCLRNGARAYPGHTGSDHDLPAKTLKAGVHGVPGGENMLRYRDGTVRYFTVHEAKLLQTFPADFYIEGVWSEAMRQIGNAVPVLLAQKLAQHLKTRLQQANDRPNNSASNVVLSKIA